MGRSTFNPIKFINPPENVLVDLATLFPATPHHHVTYRAEGLQVDRVVEAKLSRWGCTTEGETLAYVTYQMRFGRDKAPQSHLVPTYVVRPIS